MAAQNIFGQSRNMRAVVIGHTGAGNYGHGLDLIFKNVPGVDCAAVADADEKGRAAAAKRMGVNKTYADFREMLRAEKPDLVSVAPRWSDSHLEMVKTALDVGAHVFCEKPFTTSLREADELLNLAKQKKLRIAVGHQMTLAPNVQRLREEIRGGLIGELVSMRAFGKQDARAGGEDMIVLGTHLFDMMRFFAGDARRCSATIWSAGAPAELSDKRKASEAIGSVLGNEIEAVFEFDGRVTGSFTSRGRLREATGRWRLELYGTKGGAVVLMDIDPDVYLLKNGTFENGTRVDQWRAHAPLALAEKGTAAANRRLVSDWLKAIAENRESACSGSNAAKAVEMAMAVYRAHLSGSRVELPLKFRDHPLA